MARSATMSGPVLEGSEWHRSGKSVVVFLAKRIGRSCSGFGPESFLIELENHSLCRRKRLCLYDQFPFNRS